MDENTVRKSSISANLSKTKSKSHSLNAVDEQNSLAEKISSHISFTHFRH